jgi:beta-lactam-binding protein with PASTA domain
MPEPGTTVRRGWEVRLALSLGPRRITIPDIVGRSERAATITLAERGIELGAASTVSIPEMPEGQVLAQDPAANAADVASPKVTILLGGQAQAEFFVLPSFVGQPLGTVSNTLRSAGFTVGQVALAPSADAGATGQQSNSPSAAESQASAHAVPSETSSTAGGSQASPASIIVAQEPAAGQKIPAGAALNFTVQ